MQFPLPFLWLCSIPVHVANCIIMRMMPFFNLLSHALIMRRSCVIHFQLFVQAAVFILHSASHLVSTNDQRILNDAFDTIPSTVDCEKTTHTSSDGVSIKICKSGTVAIPTWVERALRLQRLVSSSRDMCSTQVFGSHNSGITLAYVSHYFSHTDFYSSWTQWSLGIRWYRSYLEQNRKSRNKQSSKLL